MGSRPRADRRHHAASAQVVAARFRRDADEHSEARRLRASGRIEACGFARVGRLELFRPLRQHPAAPLKNFSCSLDMHSGGGDLTATLRDDLRHNRLDGTIDRPCDSNVPDSRAFLLVAETTMAGTEPGHRIQCDGLRSLAYVCWIADTNQWPPRTRMKVHTSVASSGPPWTTRPLSRSTIWSTSE